VFTLYVRCQTQQYSVLYNGHNHTQNFVMVIITLRAGLGKRGARLEALLRSPHSKACAEIWGGTSSHNSTNCWCERARLEVGSMSPIFTFPTDFNGRYRNTQQIH